MPAIRSRVSRCPPGRVKGTGTLDPPAGCPVRCRCLAWSECRPHVPGRSPSAGTAGSPLLLPYRHFGRYHL